MRLQQLILRDVARENILLPLYITEENIRRKRMVTEELYVRMEEAAFGPYGADGIYFRENGVASFDTFQNGFSAGKWKKYTIIKNVFISLELQGHFEIALMHSEMKNGEVVEREISNSEVLAEERQTVTLDFGALAEEGIFYAKVKGIQAGSEIFSGFYGTEDLEPTQTVKIAIDICTFKREQYVARNIEARYSGK